MAASLSKIGVLRAQCLHYSWKTTSRHAISDQPAPPINWLHKPSRFSRFKHDGRKPKGTEFPVSKTDPSSSSSFRNSRFIGWYLNSIKTRPLATKSVTTSIIYTAADITSQTFLGERNEYELVRTLRMAGYGLLILGPSLHYWYNFMSRLFPNRDFLSTFKKMALGQIVYGPPMTVLFLSVNAALQGESSGEIVARLKRDLVPTMRSGVMYWPFCDFITFKFVPPHLQPLTANCFSYLWTVYVTYMASLDKVTAT